MRREVIQDRSKDLIQPTKKTLRNSMKPLLGKDCPDYALPIFDKRPEQLSVEQFVELTLISQKHLEKQAGDVL